MPDASPTLPQAPRQTDPVTVLLYLLMLVVVLAYVFEFVGPKRGWMGRAMAAWAAASGPVPGVQAITPPAELAGTGPEEDPAVIGAPDGELRQVYRSLYDQQLASLPTPKAGQELTLRRSTGETLKGTVTERSARHLVLQVGATAPQVRLGMVDLASADWAVAFPENVAAMRVERQMAEALRAAGMLRPPPPSGAGAGSPPPPLASNQPPPAFPPPPGARPPPGSRPPPPRLPELEASQPPPSVRPPRSSPAAKTSPSYDPTPRASSPPLQGAVREFGQWLEMQQRRMGAALAKEAWASQDDDGRAILYLRSARAYDNLEAEARQQLTETIWRFWLMRCQTHGQIQRDEQAHLVWLDAAGEILGGSRPADGSQLWVKP